MKTLPTYKVDMVNPRDMTPEEFRAFMTWLLTKLFKFKLTLEDKQ